MGGRRWSQAELEQLKELAQRTTNANIARRLGRTQQSIRTIMQRNGIDPFPVASDQLTMNQVVQLTGVTHRTITTKWRSKGFKYKKRGNFLIVEQKELLRYMSEHSEDWNATRITDDTLFRRYDWYKDKKKVDQRPLSSWSQADITTLKIRYRQGRAMKDIASELGRSESGVKNKLLQMRKHGYKL